MMKSITILIISVLIQCVTGLETDEFFPDERNALIQLRDLVTSSSNLHVNWTERACISANQSIWVGVACSDWHVTHLVLEGIQLTSSLPLPPMLFQNLTFLTKLSFKNNSLHGPLPDLTNLVHLQYVLLSKNNFSGSIPSTYIDLPELTELELQENELSGQIPPFNQQALIAFNVSSNQLGGPVPQTRVLQSFPESSYANNLGLCGSIPGMSPCPFAPAPAPASQPPARTNGGLQPWSIAVIAATALLVGLSVLCCYIRKTKEEDEPEVVVYKEKADDSETSMKLEFLERPVFELDDLLRSAAEVIGRGKLGTTYKAVLDCGSMVAVKRLENVKATSNKEFAQQMQVLGNIKHQNLAEIISFYHSKEEKIIVYDYIDDQSLFSMLHESRGIALDWTSRVTIINEIATALGHLHHNSASHGNLKSSNILIHTTTPPRVKLTDYGLLGIAPPQMLAAGRTPEAVAGKRLNPRAADVYCLGIVVLEMVTGRAAKAAESSSGGGDDLSGWVREAVSIDWSTDIVDMQIVGEREGYEDMLKLTEVALQCTDQSPERRPEISQVLTMIQDIIV
ncbi:probable leucine-rich repeat receptor-like protein kinase At1g68400 isoform X2 [Salvia hispanica]|uniref:probable leucine-rich repeat receptor-like protein kinase At1g68400 isoform X2 n=1 Tax=Salvia hispanica TaxID=49212 RepID=UPI002009A10D|nr:probable leucine-rich repeat receptor-like protein kinase At1g68400 isoform X2 [Salvia hispanica]